MILNLIEIKKLIHKSKNAILMKLKKTKMKLIINKICCSLKKDNMQYKSLDQLVLKMYKTIKYIKADKFQNL